jgi:hypothetical protein
VILCELVRDVQEDNALHAPYLSPNNLCCIYLYSLNFIPACRLLIFFLFPGLPNVWIAHWIELADFEIKTIKERIPNQWPGVNKEERVESTAGQEEEESSSGDDGLLNEDFNREKK